MADPVLIRGVRYSFEVVGAKAARAELDKADKAVEGLRASTDKLDTEVEQLNDSLGEQAAASARAGAAAKKLDAGLEQSAKGADRLTKSIGAAGSALAAAAAAFSASKLLELAEEGSGLQMVSRRLDELRISAEQVSEIGSRLGGGATSAVERLVAVAAEGGVEFQQMGLLADAALQIVQREGGDSHEAMKELTKAVVAGDVGWLRQKGIIIDVAAAQRDYAEAAGKTTAELTEQEKVAATSNAAIAELNAAFGGQAPDKYASNIGAVRDKLDNLADTIKRQLADALNDLGAALSGGSFASGPQRGRAAQAAAQVERLRELIASMDALSDASAEAQVATLRRVSDAAGLAIDETLDSVITVREEYDGTIRDFVKRVDVDAGALARIYQATQARLAGALAEAERAAGALEQREADRKKAEEERRKAEEEAEERRRKAAAGAVARAAAVEAEQVRLAGEGLSAIQALYQRFYDWRAAQQADIARGFALPGSLPAGEQVAVGEGASVSDAFGGEERDALDDFNDALLQMVGILESLPDAMSPAFDALGAFGRQMAQNVAVSILYGESLGDMATAALEALAVQALGEAIFQTGKGLAALGLSVFYPAAAEAAGFHFASAGVFAGIAALAGTGAAALGGFSERGGGASLSGGGPAGAGQSLPPAQPAGGGGPVEQTVIVDFRNRPLMTQRELQIGIVEGMRGGLQRAGRPRLNTSRF